MKTVAPAGAIYFVGEQSKNMKKHEKNAVFCSSALFLNISCSCWRTRFHGETCSSTNHALVGEQ